MTQTPPEVTIEPARRSVAERVSVVWIIPALALLIALAVAWQSFNDRGPLIEISFANGAGIKAGQTELRYRDVTVGLVEKVGFGAQLSEVVATVRIDRDVAPFIDSGASFWVVRPEVSARGVTGLDTVLSGVFIEGAWDSDITEPATEFSGLADAPLIRPGIRGLQIAMRARGDAVLTQDTPIFFKGVEVGRMGRARVGAQGAFTIAEAIIFAPHDQLISGATRFWDTSGFTFSIGAGGAEIDFTSLASLIGGGVTFDTFVSGGGRVQDGAVFDVYPDEASAKASVFNASDVETLDVTAIFGDNVAGLEVGAPVELRGFKIGDIVALNGVVDRTRFGDARVRLNATLSIQPARLGLPGDTTPEAAALFLAEQVRDGLRARLATANILTGGLKVELVTLDDIAPASFNTATTPFPTIPTAAGNISDVSATAEGVLNRINNLPIEELLGSAVTFLNAATAFVADPALQETPEAVQALLGDMSALVSSEDAQNVPVLINAALTRMETLLARLDEERAVARLLEAIDLAAGAADQIGGAVEGVPALMARLSALTAKAEALPLEDLLVETTALVRSADGLIGTDAARAVPDALRAALAAVNATLEDLRAEQGVARLLSAVDAAQMAAAKVGQSVDGVPALITQLNAVAIKAGELPLEGLVSELSALASSTEAVLGTQDARDLPGVLADALAEVQASLAELRAGGIVDNANQTIASARLAAEQVAVSVQDLPALIDRMSALLAQAGQTLQSYDGRSELNRGARDALRDIQEAAEAVSSLARTLERNPNSLLLGR